MSAPVWIRHPVVDVATGWIWLPIFLGFRLVADRVDHTHLAVGLVFLVSFAHQPLTLALVYGDPQQFAARRRLYIGAPIVALVAVLVGVHVNLVVVGLVAALWNAEHTLMQRYGVLRIYGRKLGDDVAVLERTALIALMVAIVSYLAVFSDPDDLIHRLGLGGSNAAAVDLLEPAAPFATVALGAATVVASIALWRWHRRLSRLAPNGAELVAKRQYMASTVGMVVAVLVDPVAGIGAYIGAHAIEYFAIVHFHLGVRRDASPLARATSSSTRRRVFFVGYLLAIVSLILTLRRFDGWYAASILWFGALHILYDGLVWKLRRPAVAAGLGLRLVSARP